MSRSIAHCQFRFRQLLIALLLFVIAPLSPVQAESTPFQAGFMKKAISTMCSANLVSASAYGASLSIFVPSVDIRQMSGQACTCTTEALGKDETIVKLSALPENEWLQPAQRKALTYLTLRLNFAMQRCFASAIEDALIRENIQF